jgi:hypothetical protein
LRVEGVEGEQTAGVTPSLPGEANRKSGFSRLSTLNQQPSTINWAHLSF